MVAAIAPAIIAAMVAATTPPTAYVSRLCMQVRCILVFVMPLAVLLHLIAAGVFYSQVIAADPS